MNLTWLAADLRAAGIDVREVDGWQTRAVPGPFYPLAVLIHHTGGAAHGDAPSLGVCTGGRLDLTGPLCQGLIARSGLLYLIAGGRANHAGLGAGLAPLIPTDTGNSLLVGLELENTGTGEPWPARQVEVAQIATAVVLRRISGDALWAKPRVWGHKEYAPGRKPDPVGIDMGQFRAAVARILTNPGDPVPPTTSDPTVKAMQHALNLAGVQPQLTEDGIPGPITAKALDDVLAFQQWRMNTMAEALNAIALKAQGAVQS